MSKDRRDQITKNTIHLFALLGYEGVSMRTLADEVGVAPSVLYHYFTDKDVLLKQVFDETNTNLGEARMALQQPATAREMLRQRIIFQLDHAEEIVYVLKYFLLQRRFLKKFKSGYVPDKTSLHIEEVLQFGLETNEFYVSDVELDAKVITHAINGFILEYYPAKLKGQEKEDLINLIHAFLLRALQPAYTKSLAGKEGGEKNYE